jgi:Fe-S cluster assembly protein SufD
MISASIDTDLLEQAVGRLPRDGLTALRKDALSRFAKTGFPSTRDEDWKYTNLAPAAALSNTWLRDAAGRPQDRAAADAAMDYAAALASQVDAHWIVIANGEVLPASQPRSEGLEAGSAAHSSHELLAEDPMSRFNAALLRDLLSVRVAAGTTLARPLGLLLFDDASNDATTVSHPRILIEVGDCARAQVIEYHASAGGGQHFANVVTELEIRDGATVDFVRIQDRDRRHFQVGRLHVRIARNARFNHAAFDIGGALIRNDVAVDIAEPGAAVTLTGLYLASGSQHVDNHTRIDHRAGPATSVEEYRGIATDEARAVWNGKAIVHAGADGTDARQANHNLLLSGKAEVDAKPELEIYADDVKCSHGATVGQLDESALFYLRSRGLSRAEAAQALTRAFVANVTAPVPMAAARACIERIVEARLEVIAGPAAEADQPGDISQE